MLLRSLADDEYWSEYGVMVVVDGPGGDDDAEEPLDPGPGLDGELLTMFATDSQPGGTVAHAGAGWVWGRVGWMDSYHVVRLEAHDAPPADDRGDWEEVVETPYWSHSGTVVFSTLTGGWDAEADALELGPPGRYRVRVSCVRDFSQSRADEYRPLRTTPPGFARPLSTDRGALQAGEDLTAKTLAKLTAEAQSDASLSSTTNMTVKGAQSVTVQGSQATLKGDATAKVSAGGQLSLEADGQLVIKGATIQIQGTGMVQISAPQIMLG